MSVRKTGASFANQNAAFRALSPSFVVATEPSENRFYLSNLSNILCDSWSEKIFKNLIYSAELKSDQNERNRSGVWSKMERIGKKSKQLEIELELGFFENERHTETHVNLIRLRD